MLLHYFLDLKDSSNKKKWENSVNSDQLASEMLAYLDLQCFQKRVSTVT